MRVKIPHIDPGQWRRRLVDRLRSKVRIPILRKTVSVWVILLIAVLFAFGSVGGIAVTNRSIFCSSCHEMNVHCETWQMSSHKGVECEQCHIMPGMSNMVKAKISALRLVYVHVKGNVNTREIKGHVPDVNCKKCHNKTRDVVVYHGLKITHKKHWNMGVSCTFCHARVVHGPNSATKNTPTMATCFKCHDGKKAPNTCGLCHETLGIRKPAVFSKEWVSGHKHEAAGDKNSCKRCHQSDFCDNCHRMATPHKENWLDVHPAEFAKKKQDCSMCHSDSYCQDCHQTKQAHKLGWMSNHQEEFRRQPKSCDQCHDRTFCSDCHSRYRPHPQDWESKHPGPANANPGKCKTCHEEKFCVDCHRGKTPAGHQNATWLRSHGDQISRSDANCSQCHNSNFCLECHKQQKPASHKVNWQKLHPIQAKMSSKACDTCHSKGSCDRCHGMSMPHPKEFHAKHASMARSDKRLCIRCHEQEFCKSCHRGTRPSSHGASWVKNHGSNAKNSTNCNECHTKIFCDACHTSTMPLSHGGDWRKKHGDVAEKSDSCAKCHSEKSCNNCHGGLNMPHPANWSMEHKNAKGASRKEGSMCSKCHESSYCKMCHGDN